MTEQSKKLLSELDMRELEADEAQAELEDFRDRNKRKLKIAFYERDFPKFKKDLAKHEKSGLTIWCCNGSVCSDKTPCRSLDCKFKRKHGGDVAEGAYACESFVMCVGSTDWMTAKWRLDHKLKPWNPIHS